MAVIQASFSVLDDPLVVLAREGLATPGGRDALSRLVRLHTDFVFGVARRAVRGDSALAEDITQAVFLVLAKRAGSVKSQGQLPAWLFQTTRYAAANALRTAARREHYEKSAAREKAEVHVADTTSASIDEFKLNDAIANLREAERNAILLRFFSGMDYPQVAQSMGVSEDAARKRVSRGIERLRALLSPSRSNIVPELAVVGLLTSAASEHAPVALVSQLIGAFSSAVPGVSSSSLAISKGTSMAITMAKLKVAAAVLGAVVLVGSGVQTTRMALAQQAEAKVESAPQPTWIGKLSNGVSVEMIGVAPNPSKGKAWWNPVGESIPAPYDKMGGRSYPNIGDRALEFAVRLHAPADVRWRWKILNSNGQASGSYVDSGKFPDVAAISTSLANTISSTNVRLEFATGEWTTIGENGTSGSSSSSQGNNKTIIFGNPIDFRADTIVDVVDTYTDDQCQLVAETTKGDLVANSAGESNSTGGIRLSVFTFRNLRLREIKQFRFQTRGYDKWIEFRNVSLEPGKTTKVETVTSETEPAGL